MGKYIVVEYGCVGEPDNIALLLDEIRRRQRFWNALVEIERDVRAKSLALLTDEAIQSEIDTLKSEISTLRGEIKARRKSARKRSVDIADLQAAIAERKTLLKTAFERAKVQRAAIREARKTALGDLESLRRERVKTAYNQSGLYWGNYNDEIASYKAARGRAMKEGHDLQFRPWRGEGKITVLFTSDPQDVSTVFNGENTRFQIDDIDHSAWSSPVRSTRRRLNKTRARIRVGTTDARTPVWIEIGCAAHRPLPEGRIRQASLIRRRVGVLWRYKLVVTVELQQKPSLREKGSIVAVDLGWRRTANGIRAGYYQSSVGQHGECLLPSHAVYEFEKLSRLRSILDRIYSQRHAEVVDGIAALTTVPEWLQAAAQNIANWKSQDRLYRLALRWRANRFPGDECVYSSLAAFAERYMHLDSWKANLQDQVIRRRREIYRVWASQILAGAKTLILENFDLRNVSEQQAAESSGVNTGQGIRVIVSPSTLRLALISHAEREGIQVVTVNAAMSTQRCAVCGSELRWDAASSILHRCERCGELWDQDRNACCNMLISHDVQLARLADHVDRSQPDVQPILLSAV